MAKIRLTESDLHRIVKESVRRVLKEAFTKPSNWKDTPFKGTYEDENGALYMPDDDFGSEPPYYWSISELRKSSANLGEWEVYGCVEDSSQSDDGWTNEYETPEEAYADGLEQLKHYSNGHYRLEVYYFTPNGAGDYVSGYCAEIHNGRLKQY